MEIKVKILDIFPSLKELSKDGELIIIMNEMEFILKDIINKDLSINVSSNLNIILKKENQNIGEGKIELNKITRINLNKPIITWLNLMKNKKKKTINYQKSEILNNIFEFLKIKIQININKNKTTFIPIENFNKIPINKELIKSKTPYQTKVNSLYQNNPLIKSYNVRQNSNKKNENNHKKSISFSKKSNNKSEHNILYKNYDLLNNNDLNSINNKINITSNSFIKENEDLGKEKNKIYHRTQSKKSSSKTIKRIGKNLLKNHTKKEIEELENQFLNEENIKSPQFFTENNFKQNVINVNSLEKFYKSENNFIKNESIDYHEDFSFNNDKNKLLDDYEKENEELNNKDNNLNKNYDFFTTEESIDDNNLINKEFFGLKNDFEIFYTKEYIDEINDDLLNLEVELCFEKIFELILCYHQTLKQYELENKKEKNIIKNYIKDYKDVNKQILKINTLRMLNENKKDFDELEKEIKSNKVNIFKKDKNNELNIIKKILLTELNEKNKKLKEIFSQIIIKHNNQIKDINTLKIIKTLLPKLKTGKKKNLQIETIPKNKRKTTSNPKKNIINSKKESKQNLNTNIFLSENNKKKIPKRQLNYSGSITAPNTNDLKYI